MSILASTKDKTKVTSILTASFRDNKSVSSLFRKNANFEQGIKYLMDYAFDECLEFGKVYLSEDQSACALVLMKDKKHFTFSSLIRDTKLILKVVGLGNVSKLQKKENRIKIIHQQIAPNNQIYYLWFIGVNPNSQGKGNGTQLLNEVLADAETLNRTVLLETSTLQNLPFYERAGFEIYQKLDIGYPLFCLKKS